MLHIRSIFSRVLCIGIRATTAARSARLAGGVRRRQRRMQYEQERLRRALRRVQRGLPCTCGVTGQVRVHPASVEDSPCATTTAANRPPPPAHGSRCARRPSSKTTNSPSTGRSSSMSPRTSPSSSPPSPLLTYYPHGPLRLSFTSRQDRLWTPDRDSRRISPHRARSRIVAPLAPLDAGDCYPQITLSSCRQKPSPAFWVTLIFFLRWTLNQSSSTSERNILHRRSSSCNRLSSIPARPSTVTLVNCADC